ncbi:MAG: MarR family transcriptional regulator [Clostridia bacterium]
MKDSHSIRSLIDTWYDDWFAMDRLYYEWARARGISLTTLFCLYVVHGNPEYCTPGQIATRLARSKQTVNSALDQLEAQGLILREVDPTSRRSRLVHFTAEGQSYANTLLKELDQLEERAFTCLTEDERTQMTALNQKLDRALTEVLTQEPPLA